MRRRLWALVALALLSVSAAPCLAWGAKTHTLIVYNAVELLPPGSLRDYMEPNSQRVTGYAMAPDFQLADGLSGEREKSDHYINLEYLGDDLAIPDLPRTRNDALRFCVEHRLAPSDLGFLPWRIETSYLELAAAFASAPAKAPLYAGFLAHYASDATMPLHTTADYDGLRPDPGSGSTEKRFRGVHFEYEVTFVEDSGLTYAKDAIMVAVRLRGRPSGRLRRLG